MIVAVMTTALSGTVKADPVTVTKTTFSGLSGTVGGEVTYATYKGNGTSKPQMNSGAIRLYQGTTTKTGGYVVICVPEGYTITSATIQSTMATTTGYKLTDSDPGETTPEKNTFDVNDYSLAANTDYTVSNISTRYITFACFGTTSTTRLYLSKISITYQVAGGSTPTPSISVTPTTIEAPAEEADGTITVTYENISEVLAEVKFYEADGTTEATYSWIEADVNTNNNVDYVIDANEGETRTAYLKVWAYDDDMNEVYSELITITQAAYEAPIPDFATLPFEFDGGRADIENTAGLTQEGLDSDYGSSPKLKFNNTGDYVILKFNERPDVLSFVIKNNSFSDGTFKVQTSEDGETYTDLKVYTTITGTQNEEFANFGENVRYIKWIYTVKVNGNVALGNIRLAKYGTVNVGTLTNVESVEMWYFDADIMDIEDGEKVAAGTEVFVGPRAVEGYTVETVTVVDEKNNTIEVTENSGSWSFIMPNSSVTINVNAVQGGVTPVGNKTLTNANIVAAGDASTSYSSWVITDSNGKTWNAYAIKNQHSKATSEYHFLQIKKYASNTAYYLQVPEYGTKITSITMTVSNSNQPMDGGGNTATLYFSASSTTAAAGEGVASGTGESTVTIDCSSLNLNTGYITAGGAVRIWDVAIVYEDAEPISVTFNASGYATFASSSPIDFSGAEADGYTAWAITSANKTTGVINFSKITGAVAAGTGVLLMGEAGETVYPVVTASGDNISSTNLLVGITEATEVESDQYYGLKGDTFKRVNPGTVPAGKALLPASRVGTGVKAFTFNFEDDATGLENVNIDLNLNEGIYNLAGQRLSKMQKGINIVNGKKVLK